MARVDMGGSFEMRRTMVAGTSALVLIAAMALLSFGPSAAATVYVYGCTPATSFKTGSAYTTSLSVHNPDGGAANLTHKVLAGNGTILNATLTGGPFVPP